MVVFVSKFIYYIHIFDFFNTVFYKNPLIFWLFQKKYRILHFVNKRKTKLGVFLKAKLRQKFKENSLNYQLNIN